jgi:hypothetical protein
MSDACVRGRPGVQVLLRKNTNLSSTACLANRLSQCKAPAAEQVCVDLAKSLLLRFRTVKGEKLDTKTWRVDVIEPGRCKADSMEPFE